jgi:SAM-dependent methyltransferase
VLDLGCGDGRLAARLAATGARVTGLDPSTVALERARSAHPGIEFAAPGLDGTLPFADGSFEATTSVHVLQHVADTQLLLSEVRRTLVARGRIAVAVPSHGRLKDVAVALFAFERHFDPLEPVLRFYTAASLSRLLRDFAFEDVRTRGSGGLPLARATLLATARRA